MMKFKEWHQQNAANDTTRQMKESIEKQSESYRARVEELKQQINRLLSQSLKS